jgi:hypothetical protein
MQLNDLTTFEFLRHEIFSKDENFSKIKLRQNHCHGLDNK